MTTKILITGGLGYLGGRVARALFGRADMALTLATRRSPPPAGWPADGPLVARIDWNAPESFARVCAGQQAVIHLAAMNEPDCARDAEGALTANGLATQRLLEAACRAGVERFVYVSTSKVYGARLFGTVTEDTHARPANAYAWTHRFAEDLVLARHDRGDVAAAVFRLSNGLGAPADAEANCWMLICNDLCRQAATQGRITLKSSGLAWRNFVAIGDVEAAIAHALSLPREVLGDGLFNLGGPRPLRIWDLALHIALRTEALFGLRPPIMRPDPAPGEMNPELDYCIDKLIATGFVPKAAIDDEIDETLRLCRAHWGAPAEAA